MNASLLEAIPAAHREAVEAALTSAFPGTAVTRLEPVGGGASGALIYRVETGEAPSLMRIETRRGPLRNPHQYTCLETAAIAGIAPPLRHVDADAGIAIMAFLPQRPLQQFPGGPSGLARALGQLLGRLQATPTFPHLADYFVVLDRMLGFVRRSEVFTPGLLDRHHEGFQRIREAYAWNAASLVSSHNDPNPRNIIFDGDRLWLIDWETAYSNDPLVDVAIVADNFARTSDLEKELLRAWLGGDPDRCLRARLTLMRPLTRLYYALLGFSMFAAAPRTTPPDSDLTALTPDAFRAAVAEDRLSPTGPDTLYQLGKMMLAGFIAGITNAEFDEALAVARSDEGRTAPR